MRPDRVVLGGRSPHALAIMKDIYLPLYLGDTPIVTMDNDAAELAKYACNAFLSVKISFINEMANVCDALGVNVPDVARVLGLDRRIGPKFLQAGPGFGGSCFPKDTRALIAVARDLGCEVPVVEGAY
ncbi:MAG: UDP-glucose/GDP-mannose dehydrogenase family protein, partial [Bacillati bacterium ANGP1]